MGGSLTKWFLEMGHGIGPPEGRWRQAPDIGGIPDGGRGAENGGELGEQLRVGDDARSVALSGLHLPCSSISKPRSNLDHVDGQKILRRKCCKPNVELIEGLFGARVREAFLVDDAAPTQNRRPSS